MSITLANWIVGLLGVYLAMGVVFAVPFLVKGIGKIDPVAAAGTWGFKVIIFPGVIAFWPDETDEVVYEIQLVQLPTWKEIIE